MCGIAGYLLMGGGAAPDLAAMTDALTHRGPDDGGLFTDAGVGLGHRRLAIVDPSPAGHQPMLSEDGDLALTFNGEIYNFRTLRAELEELGHRFRSATDTEVVLAAYRQWSVDCLSRFNGMWSFALWDAPRRRLFCARDRFGVKPFAYAESEGRFLFASEPKALLAVAPALRRIDRVALYRHLTQSLSGEGARSFYRDIRLLPAAHMLLVEDGALSVRRYWDYPAPDPDLAGAGLDDIAEQVRVLLEDAVALRVPGDVEAGVTLSGGLDSSAIAALLAGRNPERPVRAFSATFPGDRYDEGPKIRAFAARNNLSLEEVPQGPDALWADLRGVVRALDAPMVSPASLSLLRVMRRVHAAGLKVMFDGQGADEAFAGYDRQLFPAALRSAMAGRDWRSVLSMLGGFGPGQAVWLARALAPAAAHDWYRRLIGATGILDPDFVAEGEAATEVEIESGSRYADPLTDALWRLHRRTSLPALLQYGDAVSMACSVEYRAPFVDYRLVELAFRLPARAKMGGDGTKIALRRATAGLLEDSVRLDPVKIGFHTPLTRWLAARPEGLAPLLFSPALAAHGVFRSRALDRALDRVVAGDEKLGIHAVRWLGAALWIEQCIDGSIS